MCFIYFSCSLGLRLGGMQVYQLNLGKYLCRSKNYGRNLSVEGLKMALRYKCCTKSNDKLIFYTYNNYFLFSF